MRIPGVRPMLATALIASIANPKIFAGAATSQPASGWYQNVIRAVAKTGSAAGRVFCCPAGRAM